MRYKDLDLVAALAAKRNNVPVQTPANNYRIVVKFFKDGRPAIDHQDANVNRMFYLASEWIKQPKTETVIVYTPSGKEVFKYSAYDHM
jgi:hypothetical protein